MFYLDDFTYILRYGIPLLEKQGINVGAAGEQAKTGLFALFFLLLIPVLVGLFFLVRFIYRNTIGKKFQTTLIEDYRREAEGYENSGKFVSAAHVYETKLKDSKKAAALYEKGGDYKRAAALYDLIGISGKAKEMYERDGNIEGAAEVSMLEGDFEGAAKLYDKAGKKVDAAVVMERAGRRLAAIRAYREAGDYMNAARLLEAEGMLKEAAEMFGFNLRGRKPGTSNIEDFYKYAFKLEKAGEIQKALEVFKEIDRVNPAYKDVREKLQALAPPSPKEENLEGKTTLRSFIKSGRIEPKHCFKLWVQILKSLQEAYNSGRLFGSLSPDSIAIDAKNNISFLNRAPSSAYVPPESIKGLDLDVRADIYSAGVILYEMLTGYLEGLGSVRVLDVAEDVPDWLDEIVIKCIKKVREDRYQNIEDIFADIKRLSKGKKEPDKTSGA